MRLSASELNQPQPWDAPNRSCTDTAQRGQQVRPGHFQRHLTVARRRWRCDWMKVVPRYVLWGCAGTAKRPTARVHGMASSDLRRICPRQAATRSAAVDPDPEWTRADPGLFMRLARTARY
jgi:hypothetical protein